MRSDVNHCAVVACLLIGFRTLSITIPLVQVLKRCVFTALL